MLFRNTTALVTGATSGIGRAVALQLASQGATVIVSGRDTARGQQTVAAIDRAGGEARFVAADLSDLESVRSLADDADDATVLINNAGVFAFAPTPEQDIGSYEQMFDINVRGPFFLTAALAPRMAARGGGAIVNVSTMVAQFGMPGAAVYGASKAAIEQLTRTWAAEFATDKIRVNAVAVGPTRTEGNIQFMGEDGLAQFAQTIPLNRPADADEIGEAIMYLASPNASFATGSILAIDGGRTAI